MNDLSTEVITKALRDAIQRVGRCWAGQVGSTLPAIKLLHVEDYLKRQLDALYADTFADPEKTHAQ